MNYRPLGRTGWKVSDISFGAWAIGGFWGHVSEADALATLHKAMDCGVNFIDTADVYGDGRSERPITKRAQGRDHRCDQGWTPPAPANHRRIQPQKSGRVD